jgi:hypothetical protein
MDRDEGVHTATHAAGDVEGAAKIAGMQQVDLLAFDPKLFPG